LKAFSLATIKPMNGLFSDKTGTSRDNIFKQNRYVNSSSRTLFISRFYTLFEYESASIKDN